MRFHIKFLAFLLILNIFLVSKAFPFEKPEKDSVAKILSFKGFYGFIIPHRTTLKEQSESNPWGFQLDYAKHYINQKAWDYCGCYPRIGYSFNYTNFNNPDVLGNSYALSVFVEPYINFKNRLKASFRLGLGLTYLNQIYDSISNPENLFFSYPVSFFLQADLNFHYSINEHWNATLGFTYPHISNGGVEQPNKGINFPVASIGVEYKLTPTLFVDRNRNKSVDDLHPDRWYFLVQPFYSRKEVIEHGAKYSVFGLDISVHRIVSRLSVLHVGVELLNDQSIREESQQYNQTDYHATIASPFIGHDLMMGKFLFSQQLGVYIQKPTPDTKDLFQRIALQYKISKKVQAGVSLKTHMSVADFVDFRVGIRF